MLALLAVTVNFGWLRTWFPTIPQIAIIILNPATVIVALYAAWSLWVLRRTGSIRMSAIALFTCFLAGFGLASVIALLAFTVNLGWLRAWFPTIPQMVIIAFNPGTVLVAVYMAWSLWMLRRSGSIRQSAIALFTCFLAGFIVLTAMGSIFRGPNWHFYWWPSQWPVH